MARYQNGSVRTEQRAEGLTWVFRFYVTRYDGKRVEHKTALGLVQAIGAEESAAWREVDRQHLRENINRQNLFGASLGPSVNWRNITSNTNCRRTSPKQRSKRRTPRQKPISGF